jgi:pimeloyl-ACP methyl ester carboxylesterase
MDQKNALTLSEGDHRVIAAREAEYRLLRDYRTEVQEHYIPLPEYGIRLRVLETGSGDPVLIVPGNTGDGFPFIPLIPELRNRRLLLLNRPGGGLSEGMSHTAGSFRDLAVSTIRRVLDYFSISLVSIIAHSMGGQWSLYFAMDSPQRVQALFLLGVPGNVLETCAPRALRLMSVPILNQLLFSAITAKGQEQALDGLSFMGHSRESREKLPQSMAECYYRFQRLPHYRVSSLSLMEAANRPGGARIRVTREELGRVQCPTLLIWGENDPFGSLSTGRQIAEALPRAELRVLPGGGHLPWLDDPAQCGALISRFGG